MTQAELQIQELVARSKTAQKQIEHYAQAQVDALVKACGRAIYDNAELLAQEAVEEGGLGNVPSKITKMRSGMAIAYQFLKGKKSVGAISVDKDLHIVNYAKPMGVVACITPSTNPTSTVGGNGMYALKCRDSVIFAPHPRTKRCTVHAVELVRQALKAVGAPEDLFLSIETPTMESTQALMQQADVVVATGGPGMVKSAYSSGRPSYGVGQGNVQVLVDADCGGEYDAIAETVTNSRIRDNGVPCSCEQFITCPEQDRAVFLDALRRAGAFIIEQEASAQALRELLFRKNDDGSYAFHVSSVGIPAVELARRIGLEVPPDTKTLVVPVKAVARRELLCKEKLCPVQAFATYQTFDEGMAQILANLHMEGAGHTAVIFSHNEAHLERAGRELPVSRIIVNAAGGTAGGATLANGLTPTLSLGCGSWGNNSISENLSYIHLMNVTKMAYTIPDAPKLTDEEMWAD